MSQNYRALTRTYRPQTFDDIVSQEHVINTLKNAIKQNRVSHAYMFCGPRGVGKTTMARVLARAVNGIDASIDGEALNQTLNIVEMDAASNRKIEDVRQLKDVIRVPPQQGNYKIFIIDEVHMLTKEAFNALLKTLEEPPPHAIFIFATTEPHKVLPTILSRVQRFDFRRIAVEEIAERLRSICEKETITIDEESLHLIAKKADGALRDALGLMDQAIAFCGTTIRHSDLLQALNVVGHDLLFEFTAAIEQKNAQTGLLLIDRLLKEGTDIQEFLVSLTEHFRNLYVAKQNDRMHLVEATADTKARYLETAGAFSEEDLMRMLHLTSEAQLKIRDVQQPRIHFEILMLKLLHMSRIQNLKTLLAGLEQLKKNGWSQIDSPESESSGPEKAVAAEQPGEDQTQHNPAARRDSPEPSTAPWEPSPERQQKASSSRRGTNHTEDNDDSLLMGRPSLGFANGSGTANSKPSRPSPGDTPSFTAGENSTPVLNGIEDIEQHWSSFLDLIKEKTPQMLYFQMLRIRLKDLKGTDVIVSADNEFASNLMHENQQVLSSLFKEVSGVHMRLKCVVERNKKAEEEAKSPYERFREVQKKDPHLRTIVELFGAELEY